MKYCPEEDTITLMGTDKYGMKIEKTIDIGYVTKVTRVNDQWRIRSYRPRFRWFRNIFREKFIDQYFQDPRDIKNFVVPAGQIIWEESFDESYLPFRSSNCY